MQPNLIQVELPNDHSCFRRGALLDVAYSDLVATLGKPNVDNDAGKVDAGWCVRHADGRMLTVWNFKNGPAYLGEGAVGDVTDWSYGHDSTLAAELFGDRAGPD